MDFEKVKNIVRYNSTFSCSHFSQINDPQSMSERLMQEEKPSEEERVVAKSRTHDEFSVEDCRPVSSRIGVGVHLTARERPKAQISNSDVNSTVRPVAET